jgi:hypothetical protein
METPILHTISRHALAQRIRRELRSTGQLLRTARSARVALDLGEHYVVDAHTGGAWPTHVDLEDYGRELGVLRPYEAVADED